MKKMLIILTGIIVVLVVMMGAAIALSPIFLNKYKDQILARAGEVINRNIKMGDIRLTIFTGLGLRLIDVSLSNAKGFRDEPMLSMAGMDLKIRFLPLLHKELEVDQVILMEPRILIEKNKDGVFNFSDMGGRKAASPPAVAQKKEAETKSHLSDLTNLIVSQVRISNADLSYYDAGSESMKKGLRIQHLDLVLEDVSLEKPIPFSLSFGMNGDAKDIQIKGTMGPVGKDLDTDHMPLAVQMTVQNFAVKRIMEFLGPKPPVMIQDGILTISSDMSGDLASGLKISGIIKVDSLGLNDAAKKQPIAQGLNLKLEQDLSLHLKEQKIVFRKADLTVDRAKLDIKGEISKFQSDPSLSMQVSSSDIPLSGWDRIFPSLSGMGLDGSLEAKGSISGKPREKMLVTMDLSSANLSIKFPEKKASDKPEQKKVSEWMAPSAEAAAPAGPGKAAGSPLSEKIDFKGKIEIAKGTIGNIAFSGLKGNYAKAGNQVSLTDFSVKGFGEQGSASWNIKADLGPENPPFQAQLQTSRIDLSKLQAAFAAREEKIEGELDTRLTLSGTGFGKAELEKNLTGEGDFKVVNGVLKNVNLEEKIFSAIGGKFGLPVTELAQMAGVKIAQGDQTPFDECSGTFRIGSGKVQVQDAAITSKNHGFSATGEAGFISQELDLNARMILRQVGEPKAKKITYYLMDEKKRKYIPFKVTGNAAKPNVMVDIQALFKGQAQQVIEQKKEQFKEKIKEKLGPGGEEILKPLDKIFNF
ncbi:MAG: AsmA family protein [bacterium]